MFKLRTDYSIMIISFISSMTCRIQGTIILVTLGTVYNHRVIQLNRQVLTHRDKFGGSEP